MRTMVFAAFTMLLLSGLVLRAQRDLPPGDYKQTCRDMRVDGDRIEARCQTKDGGWHDTSVNYRDCRGEIINNDGNLRCGGDTGEGYARGDRDDRRWEGGLPRGDYKRTCQDIRVNGDRLEARCQKRDSGWRNTSLKHFDECTSGIVNDDGRLTCQR